jgi:hypothetical protein
LSFNDSVPLYFESSDEDGDLAGFDWDCNGDGVPDTVGKLEGYLAKVKFGTRIGPVGDYSCTLRVRDDGGRMTQATLRIHAIYDPPTAMAGNDTVVEVSSDILLHAKGRDGTGPIIYRAWKIGSEDFSPVTRQETSIVAPSKAGDLLCILKIMDTDSLVALDTLLVKVVPRAADTAARLP